MKLEEFSPLLLTFDFPMKIRYVPPKEDKDYNFNCEPYVLKIKSVKGFCLVKAQNFALNGKSVTI